MEVGDRLRDHRLRHGLSKRALAAEIGVSVPTVMRWEEGTAVPNDYNLYRIERLLADQGGPVAGAGMPRVLPLPLFTTPCLFTAEKRRTRRRPVLELNPNQKLNESSLQDFSANSASLRWISATVNECTTL